MDNAKKFSRICPECQAIVYCNRKKDVNYATKKGRLCRACSNKKAGPPKEKFVCYTCSGVFMDWRSQLANPERPFCSKQCWYNSNVKSLEGKIFGRLQVISRERKHRTTYYKCQCSCGNISTVTHTNLLNGTESCGCLIKETRIKERKPLTEVISRAVWTYYKRNAKLRNYEWKLSYEEFIKLINGKCNYCGTEKGNTYNWHYKYETASAGFNGIDRLNNEIGYVLDNCVPCCFTCNAAKGALTLEQFKSWAKKLFDNLSI